MTNAEKDAIKKLVKELGEARSENSLLTAENAQLRAEVERLGERLGKMKYPETICTG